MGLGGLSPTASLNLSSGNSSSSTTNIEAVLSAGNSVTVTTPDALLLEGAQIRADRVMADLGALTIESLQDTSEIRSRQSNIGVSVNIADGLGGSASFNRDAQDGNIASVAEQ